VQVLLPFHSAVRNPLSQVETSIAGTENGCCRMVYRITGHTPSDGVPLCLPARCASPGFADELWHNTCCEAFVATAGQTAYREFNFSPSGQWAIYDFADYRQAMRRHLPDAPPKIDCQPTPDGFVLTVDLPLTLLGPPPWQIGLSCILKTTDGSVDYRALRHASDRPDFHQRASFTLRVDSLPPVLTP
jgi:hypothetical protein